MSEVFRRGVVSSMIFWLFVGLCAVTLAIGWAVDHVTIAEFAPGDLIELYVSAGLTAAIALLAYLLAGLASRFLFGRHPAATRRIARFWLRLLIVLAFVGAVAAGVLALAARGEQIFFWRYPLPLWVIGDPTLEEPLMAAHRYAADLLAGAILLYFLFLLYDRLVPATPSVEGRALELATPPTLAAILADNLAHGFGVFGGFAFWLQLLLGIVSALLLVFGYVGHTVSPDHSGFGDAITWATAGFALLIFSTLFAFIYMKAARRIRSQLTTYLGHERRMAFWFVGLGGLISIAGVLVSFVGVGLSVALLIGKTVSQPPGIAITDPQKIVRALDIFILLVNFNLLFAHFIGFGVAAWLSISAWKARHQYLLTANADD